MVASLLDKAPNLAGLSRTCEVSPYNAPLLELGRVWVPSPPAHEKHYMEHVCTPLLEIGRVWVPSPPAHEKHYMEHVCTGLRPATVYKAAVQTRWAERGHVSCRSFRRQHWCWPI